LIVLGSSLFTRSLEPTIEKFFQNKGMGLRLLGNMSLSLPELILPLFAFLAPGRGKTAIDAGTGALFGPPIFLFLFLLPLVSFLGKKSARILLKEIPLLLLGLGAALLLLGRGELPRLFLATILAGFYLWALLLVPPDEPDPRPEIREAPEGPAPYRLRDGAYVVAGTLLMTVGSHFFLSGIDLLSQNQGFKAFWIALLLTPLATEAPELLTLMHFLRKKSIHQSFSILWGSIHFQLTLSIASGLIASPWKSSGSTIQAGSALLGILVLAFVLGAFRLTFMKDRPS
jgi:cation:H+ antiporter